VLRAALLAALPSFLLVAPVAPAHAADPGLLVCAQAEARGQSIQVCDFYDPAYDLVVYSICTEGMVRGAIPDTSDPIGRNTYTFTGAVVGGKFVKWSETYCRIGSAQAVEPHDGQFGFMSAGVAGGPRSEETLPVCTSWAVRFNPGDPRDHDPNTTYYTQEFCR
jgi:hypothetical protein